MNPQDCIETLENYISLQKETIVKVEGDLARLHDEVRSLTEQRDDEKTGLLAFSKVCKQETDKLEVNLRAFKTEVQKLEGEISALVAEKGQLKQDNISLYNQNKSFREYEAKAIKVLRTTEESLTQREKAIQQKESFRGNKSILPPRD